VIWVHGLAARTQASQGEQRSVALALRLGGHALVTDRQGTSPVLLLDDVFSELDPGRCVALASCLPDGQTLLTAAGPVPDVLPVVERVQVCAGTVHLSPALSDGGRSSGGRLEARDEATGERPERPVNGVGLATVESEGRGRRQPTQGRRARSAGEPKKVSASLASAASIMGADGALELAELARRWAALVGTT